ncbi:MAG: DUF952 domain-containing protein [Filomicrobium sp.]
MYKILLRSEWENAVSAGSYRGSTDDRRDGFIHFSTAEQLQGTAAKFFRDQSNLLLVSFEAHALGEKLVWEPSRGGALFPHLYADLPTEAALEIVALELGADGVPKIPEGLR